MGRVGAEQRAAAEARLEALRVTGGLTTAHVRLAATGLHVAERTVWRWLGPDTAGTQVRPGARLTGCRRPTGRRTPTFGATSPPCTGPGPR